MGKPPDKWILIDTKKFELQLCEHEWTKFTYPIGLGKADTPTPTGNYWIYEMCENPKWAYRVDDARPVGVYGTRAISLSLQCFDFDTWCWRTYSIHGTNDESCIGKRCSGGCIRMRNADIEELYDQVGVGLFVMMI